MRRILLTVATTAACLAATPAAAHAATITLEDSTYVVRGDDGPDILTVGPDDDGLLVIRTPLGGQPLPPGCVAAMWDEYAHCPVAGRALRIETAGGDDTVGIDLGTPVLPITVLGGAGNDKLTGHEGAATLDGGPGNDTVSGGRGPDVVLGGEGNDTVTGDGFASPSADVIDGGPGIDTGGSGDWMEHPAGDNPAVVVTLDGLANDGSPGEGDNVTSIEKITYTGAGTFVAGSDAVDFEIPSNSGSVKAKLVGGPLADRLKAAHGHDELDGGAGDDTLEGGYGDDVIVGGPGRDTINADASAGCDFVVCHAPVGNDTVHARDGEADRIECGVGNDVAFVDELDTTSGCETVHRGTAGAPHAGGGPQGGGQVPGTTRCTVPKIKRGLKLSTARSRLKKAGCATKTVRTKSKSVRKGRVIRISAKAGKKTTKKVTIYVSRGLR